MGHTLELICTLMDRGGSFNLLLRNEIKRDKERKIAFSVDQFDHFYRLLVRGRKNITDITSSFQKISIGLSSSLNPFYHYLPQLFDFPVKKCQSLPGVLHYEVKAFSFPKVRLQHFPRLSDGFNRNQTFQIRYFIL